MAKCAWCANLIRDHWSSFCMSGKMHIPLDEEHDCSAYELKDGTRDPKGVRSDDVKAEV